MADKAHTETDKRLSRMERRLSEIYAKAEKDIIAKADEYFKQFDALDKKKRQQVQDGKLTEYEYGKWRRNKIMYGRRWERERDRIVEGLKSVRASALAYINGELPEVYSINYNYTNSNIGGQVKGYSFDLINPDTVRNLAREDQTFLPYKEVNLRKYQRWCTSKVNSAIMAGIISGDSIPNLAKRLASVSHMDHSAAVRNARTMVTSAENKARQDGFDRAAARGIIKKKQWLATKDLRTRHEHALVDRQITEYNEPFNVGGYKMKYPGDTDAPAHLVYNCRCTVVTAYDNDDPHKMRVRNPLTGKNEVIDTMSYLEWYNTEREKNPSAFDAAVRKQENKRTDTVLYNKYKRELGKNAPQSLAKMQEMKYNNPKEWSQYKTYVRSIRSGELTALADFTLYKKTSSQIDSEIVGITTSNGITISSKSDHFISRVIGSVEQRRSGVSIDKICKALTSPDTIVYPIKQYADGLRSQKFFFDGVEVTVNPDTGNLIQVNPNTKRRISK